MSKPSLEARALAGRLVRDQRGAVSLFGAISLLLGLGFAVVAIDGGHLYLARRRLQAAVDAAALAAAAHPADAARVAGESLAGNGYIAPATVMAGGYSADPALPPEARFDPDAETVNAVRVSAHVAVPGFFTRIFAIAAASDVKAEATAARIPLVSFAAGTTLAGVDGGALNRVLGGLLGANLSLSAGDYQSLAAANLDALTFLDQLALKADMAAGSYGDLADASVTLGEMIAAAQAAIGIRPPEQAAAVLDVLNLLSLEVPRDVSARLGQIVDFSMWRTRAIGSIAQQTPGAVTLNLFDLLSAAARIYGAGHVIDLGTAISLPVAGTSITAKLAVGQQGPAMAIGPAGTRVATAAARLALTVTAARLQAAGGTVAVRFPVYVRLAPGEARAAVIPCRTDAMATIAARSQAADIAVGAVPDARLSDFSQEPQPQPASVAEVDLPLLAPILVDGAAASHILEGPESARDFSQADIDGGAMHTVAAGDDGALIGDVSRSLSLSLEGAGVLGQAVDALLSDTILPLIGSDIGALLTALDPAVDGLLQASGLRLGALDAAVRGVRCGVPVLVR